MDAYTYVAAVLFYSDKEEEVLVANLKLQYKCMEILKPPGFYSVLENVNLKGKLWFLVIYNTEMTNVFDGKETVFQIFCDKEVILEHDHQTALASTLVQYQQLTYKGVVVQLGFGIDDLMEYMKRIRNVPRDDITTTLGKYSLAYVQQLIIESYTENSILIFQNSQLLAKRLSSST